MRGEVSGKVKDMIVAVHKRNEKTIVAVCDSELLGKVFEEGEAVLDLTSSFYRGDEVSEREAGDLVRNADIVNLVGKKAVALGLLEDVIEEATVKVVLGVPYAQAVID